MDADTALAGFRASLSAELRTRADARLRSMRFGKGRTLLGRSSASTDVFFVMEGRLSAVLYSTSGREVFLRGLEAGDLFGELAALDGLPRSAAVVAETDARVCALSRADFMACLEASSATGLWLARHLAAQVRRLTDRTFELSALNMQTRLLCELLRLARTAPSIDGAVRIEPAPTHAEIASRIGSNREAVTREMRALAEGSIIRHRRRLLEFLDVAALERTLLRRGAAPA